MSGELEYTFEGVVAHSVAIRVVSEFMPGQGWTAKIYGEATLPKDSDQIARPVISRHYAQTFGHLMDAVATEISKLQCP